MVKNSFTPIIPQEENKGSQVFSFINKLKRIIRNSSVSKKFYYSVIVRTCFQKDNYDSLIRFFLLCSYSDLYIYNYNKLNNEYRQKLPVYPKIFALMIGYPILIKAFLVLRFKIHKKDELYNFLIKKIKKNFSIAKSAYDNINSEYQKNLKPEDVFEPEDVFDPKDVFAPYAHLWTFCKNCETSIYKQYAQKNKYICQHCAFHLPMESFDRIESLIDSGTWDSTDENMVSTDPYEILRKNLASAYDEDANQNSKKSIKSEESTESEESQESEESTESEESQESEESTESEESQESEESTESEESQESEEDIPYMDKVDSYQRKTGLTDAVQTGIGQLDGIPVALAVMDFQFIGGSMGSVVGEKITRLIQYATRKSLPLIISCASGGARMQEGSFSLMQMAKISSTLFNFQFHENLFLVSLLTSPTTGGVTASFGMLGDIIIGEPDAYIAFAGKRVIEEVMKIEVPEGVQEAEYLFEMGSLDSIVPRNLLKGVLSELLTFHDIFHFSKSQNKKQGGLCSEEFGI